jgi:hypothetical protein
LAEIEGDFGSNDNSNDEGIGSIYSLLTYALGSILKSTSEAKIESSIIVVRRSYVMLLEIVSMAIFYVLLYYSIYCTQSKHLSTKPAFFNSLKTGLFLNIYSTNYLIYS